MRHFWTLKRQERAPGTFFETRPAPVMRLCRAACPKRFRPAGKAGGAVAGARHKGAGSAFPEGKRDESRLAATPHQQQDGLAASLARLLGAGLEVGYRRQPLLAGL